MFRVALLVLRMIILQRTYYRTNNTNIVLNIIIYIHILVLRHLMMIISSPISFHFVLKVLSFLYIYFFIPCTTSLLLDECCLQLISFDWSYTEIRLFHSPFDSHELPWCHWTSPLSSPNLSRTAPPARNFNHSTAKIMYLTSMLQPWKFTILIECQILGNQSDTNTLFAVHVPTIKKVLIIISST